MDYSWDFGPVLERFDMLALGMLNTVKIAAVSIVLGVLVGLVLATTQSGALYAEVFRGGIVSIERGQWEGGRALGMTHFALMRRVVLPQAISRMVPPFIERSFELLKTTALASTLAYADLLYQAMLVNAETFRPLEVYTTIALMYLVLLVTASQLARLAEARLTAYQ
ncbi:MAG: ABC transporter permease subunit [Maritimibacter sp.]